VFRLVGSFDDAADFFRWCKCGGALSVGAVSRELEKPLISQMTER
jgi:hypothetical protein